MDRALVGAISHLAGDGRVATDALTSDRALLAFINEARLVLQQAEIYPSRAIFIEPLRPGPPLSTSDCYFGSLTHFSSDLIPFSLSFCVQHHGPSSRLRWL